MAGGATRLQVVLARAGIASRRASEALILDGAVAINGRVVTELGTRVDPEDRVTVRGKPLSPARAHRYFVLNKPREVVTTARDPQGRRTVLDFVAGLKERVWPVGRLDYHSEGLVILTNDGELTHALTHPGRHVPRVYHARVGGALTAEEREKLRRGVRLAGRLTGPIEARPLRQASHSEGHAWLEIVVHEGRYHLVREALARVGHPVSRLKRVAFGPLKLGRMPAGAVRELRPEEVDALRRASAPRPDPARTPRAGAAAMKRPNRPEARPKRANRPGGAAKRADRPEARPKRANRPGGATKRSDRPVAGSKRPDRPAAGSKRPDRPASSAKRPRRPVETGKRPERAALDAKPPRRPPPAKGRKSSSRAGRRPSPRP